MSQAMLNNLPKQVTITEVCPRDGFQNIKEWIPTEKKLSIIRHLLATGIKHIEVTSFVSPKAIPQMSDAATLVELLVKEQHDCDLIALVANIKGAEKATASGIKHINYVISSSPEHNLANIQRTHEVSLNKLKELKENFPELKVTVSLATVFGCPFIGQVATKTTKNLIRAIVSYGLDSVTLCDTIGVAVPAQVDHVLESILSDFPTLDFGLHLHNTHGTALANTIVALQHGIARFETAAAGLGGCPFAPGAAGNCATEDLLNMLHRMGINTGIDLQKYIDTAKEAALLDTSSASSQLIKARPYIEHNFFTFN